MSRGGLYLLLLGAVIGASAIAITADSAHDEPGGNLSLSDKAFRYAAGPKKDRCEEAGKVAQPVLTPSENSPELRNLKEPERLSRLRSVAARLAESGNLASFDPQKGDAGLAKQFARVLKLDPQAVASDDKKRNLFEEAWFSERMSALASLVKEKSKEAAAILIDLAYAAQMRIDDKVIDFTPVINARNDKEAKTASEKIAKEIEKSFRLELNDKTKVEGTEKTKIELMPEQTGDEKNQKETIQELAKKVAKKPDERLFGKQENDRVVEALVAAIKDFPKRSQGVKKEFPDCKDENLLAGDRPENGQPSGTGSQSATGTPGGTPYSSTARAGNLQPPKKGEPSANSSQPKGSQNGVPSADGPKYNPSTGKIEKAQVPTPDKAQPFQLPTSPKDSFDMVAKQPPPVSQRPPPQLPAELTSRAVPSPVFAFAPRRGPAPGAVIQSETTMTNEQKIEARFLNGGAGTVVRGKGPFGGQDALNRAGMLLNSRNPRAVEAGG